jgi:Outer membrane protein beta-barrel domain
MKKAVLFGLALVVTMAIQSPAQQAGALVGSIGLGLTAAQGDFANSDLLAAGSGFGIEAQARYYLFSGFGFGPMINYMRFGSSYESDGGEVSYNFSQLGGMARLNLFGLSNGAVFVNGGGGIFKPNAHFYSPDNPTDVSADKSGNFFFGGLGLTSYPTRRVIYEFEIRYNIGSSPDPFALDATRQSDVWDFIYAGVRLSFASKGQSEPPKY